MAKSLMIQGTASNVGKSILVAGLCRILKEDGFSVAPFKAQNMALNSFVTRDGFEMGRAQVTQAQAAKIEPDIRMNPVLLKPNSDNGSQVILNGKPIGNYNAQKYYKTTKDLFPEVLKAYKSLASDYDIVILEGAGSCAEINLRSNDIVNMSMAHAISSPVLIAGDIDTGGVFAHFVGTIECLEPEKRELVKGFLINKFRGDKSLLKPAVDFVTQKTGIPTLGIIDYKYDLSIPEEDSVEFQKRAGKRNYDNNAEINIAVIELPHTSNFTDIDAFEFEENVNLTIINSPDELEKFDVVIIPGSKNTINDFQFLEQKGFSEKIKKAAEAEKIIVGICGGYQMLGKSIEDPGKIESSSGSIKALELLNLKTVIGCEKKLKQSVSKIDEYNLTVSGYEIHHGTSVSNEKIFMKTGNEATGHINSKGNVWGTYLHGIFDNDEFRNWFLNEIRKKKCLPEQSITKFSYEKGFRNLADYLRKCLSLKEIYKIIGL